MARTSTDGLNGPPYPSPYPFGHEFQAYLRTRLNKAMRAVSARPCAFCQQTVIYPGFTAGGMSS